MTLLLALPLQAALPVAVDGQPLPSLAPMLERITPAVVNIATRGKTRRRIELPLPAIPLFRRFFDLPGIERIQETSSLGSGVIVDAENGLILTNDHVIKDAYEINVTLTDGRELQREITRSRQRNRRGPAPGQCRKPDADPDGGFECAARR